MITKKYYKLIRVSHEDEGYLYIKNVSNENGVFKMIKTGSPTAPNLEYSLDGLTWTSYDFTTLPEVSVNVGSNIYLRGTNSNNQFNKSESNYMSFSFNKTCEAHGNICSLFNTNPSTFSTITNIGDYGIVSLFRNFTTLTTAPNFENIVTMNQVALYNCFEGCTSLATAPDFTNLTTLNWGSMRYAFKGCTSLTTAPYLSNVTTTTVYSIADCFTNCTSLTNGPDFSKMTTVGDYCLENCFYGCINISTVTAPNTQNLTQNNVLHNWLGNNAGSQATGTKVVNVPTGATITTGSNSGIPTGWTRVDY